MVIRKTTEQIQDLSLEHCKEIKLKENIPIIIDYFPDSKLIELIMKDLILHKWSNSYLSNVNAEMTEWNTIFSQRKVFQSWLNDIIGIKFGISKGYKLDFYEMWFARYSKGDYTKVHNHINSLYSFVFFLNSPEGSSPLVFTSSKTEIEPQPGKLVLFPGCVYHHVPKNNCKNRVVLAGNININIGEMSKDE